MKNKTCMICKTTIERGKEQYVEVKHYSEKEEILSKGYYHIKCFRERLNGSSEMGKLQKAAINFIKGASKKVGIEEEPEVTIL